VTHPLEALIINLIKGYIDDDDLSSKLHKLYEATDAPPPSPSSPGTLRCRSALPAPSHAVHRTGQHRTPAHTSIRGALESPPLGSCLVVYSLQREDSLPCCLLFSRACGKVRRGVQARKGLWCDGK
jgi:hypothetical protein